MLSPLVAALAAAGEVVATDWIDARLVPRSEGGFGLEGQIAAGLEAAAALGAPAHLVALSQSGPAALAVAALLAGRTPELALISLAFLGCQLDPAARHTPLQRILARWPRPLLAASLTAEVGPGYPGSGRRVYPSVLQLLAYGLASPRLYADVQHGLLRELSAGQAGAATAASTGTSTACWTSRPSCSSRRSTGSWVRRLGIATGRSSPAGRTISRRSAACRC